MTPQEPQRRITAGTVRWTLLGILGLALAVGVALVASSLASQRIGLSDEPISAGSALQPPRSSGKGATRPVDQAQTAGGETTTSSTTPPENTTGPEPATNLAPPPATPPTPTPTRPDDHGDESGHGSGGSNDD